MTEPVVFVHANLHAWSDVLARTPLPHIDELANRLTVGTNVWTMATYIMLRRGGCDVEISSEFRPNRICVAHYDDVSPRDLAFSSYVVAIRADRDRTFICDEEVVQSPACMETAREHYVPLWPQPGLVPRDENRGPTVERLAYFGRRRNLAASFLRDSFVQRLREIGIEFVIKDKERDWVDYSGTDVVLAVRDGSPYFLAAKPVNKLVNAWRAGCPALVGDEPIYSYHRKSESDYFHVANADDVVRALTKLKSEPGLYAQMVQNGKKRAREFSYEPIQERWIELLFGTIRQRYEKWRSLPTLVSYPLRAGSFTLRYAHRRLRGRQYFRDSAWVLRHPRRIPS